jgi:tetratricopeptide (TPR) repeat protein
MRRAETRKKTGQAGIRPGAWLTLLFCLMVLFGGMLSPAYCRADLVDLLAIPALVPERDVSFNSGTPVAWKKTWDEARYLTRTGEFQGAEEKYEELLALKSDIDLARWEYGRLLLKIGKWDKASATIELLVEKAPEQVDYLNGLGLALRKLGHFSRALDLFRKAHENDPGNLTALAGLAQGLVEVGLKKEAFPLFEKISAERPEDVAIHRALANLAFELGKLETARRLMAPLVKGNDADLDTLLMTARIYEGLNQDKEAVSYWQRCLKHDPANREARGRLTLYYEKQDRPGKAIPHLLALLENDSQNASLLRRICRLYIQTDRFAEALPYFERYVSLQPDNLDGLMPVSQDKIDSDSDAITLYRRLLAVTPEDLVLLDGLANDLLMAGDPETALFMWEHVARLYPDRVEVYQELVALLERLGRDERLTEILEVIHRLAPGEIKVVSKLANLKVAQGDLPVGLEYYNKLEKAGYAGVDLYTGRGALYESLGRSALALADYKKLLVLQPSRHDIRRRALVLAGKLGENRFLLKQAELLDAANDAVNRDSDLFLVAQAFADAHDFDQSQMSYQRLIVSGMEAEAGSPMAGSADLLVRQANLGLADLYRGEDLLFESEQILRKMYLAPGDQREVLKRLFDLSLIHNRQLEDAGVWLGRFTALNGDPFEAIFMKARLLAAYGDDNEAVDLLESFLYSSVAGAKSLSFPGRKGAIIRQTGLLLAEILIKAGDLGKAERQCLAMLNSDQDSEVLVLLQKIYDLEGEDEAAVNIFNQLFEDADNVFKLLRLAELFNKYGLLASRVAVTEKAMDMAPGSLTAAFSLAAGWAATGKRSEAIELLEHMASMYPENSAIILKIAYHYYLNSQYNSALLYCDRFLERKPGHLKGHLLKVQCRTVLGEYEYAKHLIEQLFPIKTTELLEKSVSEAGINVALPPVKRTFFQLLTFSSSDKKMSLARELMSSRHLLDNSTKNKKELNFIAVPLYARYRWEQEFRKAMVPG